MMTDRDARQPYGTVVHTLSRPNFSPDRPLIFLRIDLINVLIPQREVAIIRALQQPMRPIRFRINPMLAVSETILSVLPGQSEQQRTVIAMRNRDANTAIEMRQESFSDAVGWFVQSRIELSTEQVAELRQTLGTLPLRCRPDRNIASSGDAPATLAFPCGDRAATA